MLTDSDRIAEILADGWARAYGGFLPAHILAPRADRAARREELRAFMADEFDPETEAMLVAEYGEKVVGFVHAMLGNKADLGTGGQISLLYVEADMEGHGIGRALLAEAADWLRGKTAGSIAIAAFKDNPYHPFYAHMGGELVKTVDVRVGDFPCQSLIYLWPSAAALRRSASPD